jgi:hypothetical protein
MSASSLYHPVAGVFKQYLAGHDTSFQAQLRRPQIACSFLLARDDLTGLGGAEGEAIEGGSGEGGGAGRKGEEEKSPGHGGKTCSKETTRTLF